MGYPDSVWHDDSWWDSAGPRVLQKGPTCNGALVGGAQSMGRWTLLFRRFRPS